MLFSTARYINDRLGGVTHLQLQKLVYIAFGLYAAKHDEDLFDNRIEAWEYGPVIPDLYNEVKEFENKRIPTNAIKKDGVLGKKQIKEIDLAINSYGKLPGITLETYTHQEGSPWHQTRRRDEIDKELISDYYRKVTRLANTLMQHKQAFKTLAME